MVIFFSSSAINIVLFFLIIQLVLKNFVWSWSNNPGWASLVIDGWLGDRLRSLRNCNPYKIAEEECWIHTFLQETSIYKHTASFRAGSPVDSSKNHFLSQNITLYMGYHGVNFLVDCTEIVSICVARLASSELGWNFNWMEMRHT